MDIIDLQLDIKFDVFETYEIFKANKHVTKNRHTYNNVVLGSYSVNK